MSRRKVNDVSTRQRGAADAAFASSSAAGGASGLNVDERWYSAGAAALFLAFVWSYWPTLVNMVHQWIVQPDYSHGFLVVPLAGYFLWTKRDAFPLDKIRPSIWGGALLLLAAAMRVGAGKYFLGPLDGWTMPLWIAGVVWLLWGWPCLRWSLPAIVFLWFMIPIPFSAESMLSQPLQAISTRLSTMCLVLLGQPALAEGNTIWLGDHHLNVEEACSGLRIFIGIFALSFAFVLFSRWAWWQKVLTIVATLPIAIIANVTRLVVTGLLYQYTSGDTAQRFSHDLSGIVMIPFAAGLFWVFLIYLERLFPEAQQMSAVDLGFTARR